jgi:hypothetical protein
MLKKVGFLVIVSIIVLPLIMVMGCSGGGFSNPIALVPDRANMVGGVNLSQILGDEDFADIYDRLPKEFEDPQTLDDALDDFKEKRDIDLRWFEQGVFFGDVSKFGDDAGYFGIIIRGDFDKNDLIRALEKNVGGALDTIKYQGYEIHTNANETAAIAFLSDTMFVIGGMGPVKDVIQVHEGDRKALSGEVLDTYNGLGDALITVATVVPADQVRDRLPRRPNGFEMGFSAFSDVEKAGLVLVKEEKTISLKLELEFTNSESAEDAENLLSFVEIFVDMIPIPEQGRGLVPEVLDWLEVERSGSKLTISIEMTVSEIEDLLESSKST